MNLQVIAAPGGDILWVSGALPGSVHDKRAEWIWGVLAELEAAGLVTLADKGYPGAAREDPLQGQEQAGITETGQQRPRETRQLELRVAELERRLSMDSADSGTPSSKERIGAKETRRARQESERERRKDRRRGGQPGHQGKGLKRDPDPDDRMAAEPPAECRSCRASLDRAEAVEPRWAQAIDAVITRKVAEWLLPGLWCPCCGTVTFADPSRACIRGPVSYGPVLNAAAVLSAYANVPSERSAHVIGMLLGTGVSAGWVDRAAARVNAQLGKAGFDDAMIAAVTAEDVLAADETR
jgi:hypothetical protein